MIDLQLYLAFVLAVVLLAVIPGPNVALIVANSVAHGTRYGLLTVAGTTSALVVQLSLAAFGMTKVLSMLGGWFELVRWIGVAYLIYLGLKIWRAPVADLSTQEAEPKSTRMIFMRAFLVSLTNPKLLLFYGAFFPQFVDSGKSMSSQIAILCATFLSIAVLMDGGWAIAAGRARAFLNAHSRLRNRISGGLLIGAGVGLAVARNK